METVESHTSGGYLYLSFPDGRRVRYVRTPILPGQTVSPPDAEILSPDGRWVRVVHY